jgi:hypothetical protein
MSSVPKTGDGWTEINLKEPPPSYDTMPRTPEVDPKSRSEQESRVQSLCQCLFGKCCPSSHYFDDSSDEES